MPAFKQTAKNSPASKTSSKKEEVVVEDDVEEHVNEVSDTEDVEESGSEVEENEVEENEDEVTRKSRKSKKIEFPCENADIALAELIRIDGEMEQITKLRKVVFKQYQKLIVKQLKQSKKRRNNLSDAPKEATGFIKAKPVPEKFRSFYQCHQSFFSNLPGFKEFKCDVPQPRTEITKMIYAYIRENNLYKKKEDGSLDKREILPDSAIRSLLDVSNDDKVGFNNFQTFVSRLYADKESEEDSADDVERVVETVSKSKGGKNHVKTAAKH